MATPWERGMDNSYDIKVAKQPEQSKEICLEEQLAEATERGNVSALRDILQSSGLKPDVTVVREGFDKSPLSLACIYGRTSVAKELLQEGADPTLKSTTGRIPLHEACIGGHSDVMSLLLDNMISTEITDGNGQTAAHLAAYNGEGKCLSLLAVRGADLTAKDQKGRQPAHLAAVRNHVKVLRFLFDQSVDLDCPCHAGKTPLHYAAQHGALESMIFLVEHDCDMTVGDNKGFLAAHLAARHDKLDCLQFLVLQGTELDVLQSDARTPAHVAALYGACNVLHWLLENGADVNRQDCLGNTSAHYAGEGRKADCFNCCMHHGGALDIVNEHEDTPLDSAKKAGCYLLTQKALRNEVQCPDCQKKEQLMQWEEKHQPSSVERSISRIRTTAYVSPLSKILARPVQQKQNPVKLSLIEQVPKDKMPKRDLAAKYFGEYLDPNKNFSFFCTQ